MQCMRRNYAVHAAELCSACGGNYAVHAAELCSACGGNYAVHAAVIMQCMRR